MSFLRRLLQAIQPKPRATPQDPQSLAALNLIEEGQEAEKQGKLDEARKLYEQAVAQAPNLAKAHMNLGNAHLAARSIDDALASYQRAVEIDPNYAQAHYNLGNAHWHLARNDLALQHYLKATDLDPKFALPWVAIANTLGGMGKVDEAIDACRHAISLEQDDAESHLMLGMLLKEKGEIDESIESLRKAVDIRPDHPFALPTLAELLSSTFRLKDAKECVRRAIQLAPHAVRFRTALLYLLSEDDTLSPDELFREHVAAGEQIVAKEASRKHTHAKSNDPDRILHIGFLSGDFNNHPVSYFTTPIIRSLSTRADIRLYAYSNSQIEDDVTRTIRPLFHEWRNVSTLDDDGLDELIRSDGINILVDLSGHTQANRMAVLARKPAPIQASWIGYAGTTGMSSVDYYFADRHFLPRSEFQNQFLEKLVHLPASGSFQPLAAAHEVNALPSLNGAPFTFGSFNRLSKFNPKVVETWARVLQRCPESRLLIASVTDQYQVNSLTRSFNEHGVDANRLLFKFRCGFEAFLNLHHQVDLCLDTFPYSGGTTTLYAMWMGVPTLTLAGKTPFGRQSAWSLEHTGLNDYITHSQDDFISRAVNSANHKSELAETRMTLRKNLLNSAICQPENIAFGMATAFRIMWKRKIAGLENRFIDLSDAKNSSPETHQLQ